MLRVVLLSFVLALISLMPQAAHARVTVQVDISEQRMRVYVGGELQHVWAVSTGRGRYRTPIGNFRPRRLERSWYSRKYDNAPMPHSIFFYGGYAIHGTNHVRQLGRRASHGCVRLSRGNAARLFSLVRRHGPRRVRIAIRH
jgi:lipoprotein-anchoring transpeptidase ErfK/SrfK